MARTIGLGLGWGSIFRTRMASFWTSSSRPESALANRGGIGSTPMATGTTATLRKKKSRAALLVRLSNTSSRRWPSITGWHRPSIVDQPLRSSRVGAGRANGAARAESLGVQVPQLPAEAHFVPVGIGFTQCLDHRRHNRREHLAGLRLGSAGVAGGIAIDRLRDGAIDALEFGSQRLPRCRVLAQLRIER